MKSRLYKIFITAVPLFLVAAFAMMFSRSAIESPASPATGITGKVTFNGKAPANQVWTVGKNRAACGNSKTLDRLIVDKNGGVENALIIVKNVSGSTAGMSAPKIDQKSCRYLPHVQIAAVNSSLMVENSDDVLHNIHGYYEDAERTTAFNFAQPILDQKTQVKLNKKGLIGLVCDAGHSWMSAYIYVTDNPYVAVSGADGSFSIPNVPPGTYTVQCWHEGWKVVSEKEDRPNFSEPKVSEQTITVGGGGAQLNFQIGE